jgi:predicted Zn-dependent peptidase
LIKQYKLSNGVVVVTENLPHNASATVGIFVRAGSVDEARHGGISHFIEHMLFKGTKTRGYRQIPGDIEKLGGSINAFTGREATCYYVKSLSSNLFASIDVLSDIMTNSLFDQAEIDKERQVIIEEMKMVEDVPDDWGSDLITESIFRGSELERRVIGTRDSVSAITRDDMLGYMAERYTADSIVISCSGMFDEEALREKLEAGFGAFASVVTAPRSYTPGSAGPQRECTIREIEQTHLFLGTNGLKFLDDDVYALNLYSAILGGGMSSRLFTAVREEKGLAYSVYSADAPYVEDGQFVIYAGVAHDKLTAALGAMKDVIVKLAEDGVHEEELSRVKEQYKGGFVFRGESNSSRMFTIGRNMILLDRIITDEEILAKIDSITGEDVRRIAARFADLSKYSAVVIGGQPVDLDRLLG